MKRLFISLAVFSIGLTLFAQETVDLVTLTGRYSLPQSYKDTYTGEAHELGFSFAAQYGKNVTKNSMLAININHFYFNVQGDPAIPDNIANPMILNGTVVRTGLIQSFSNGRKLQLLLAPRLMSDFKNLDGNSFQMGAVVSFERRFNDDLKLGFGAMYNQERFGPYFVPLFILNWQVSSKWNINGLIPITARIEYKAKENLTIGINHFGMSTSYYLGDEAYAGDYIERLSIDPTLFVRQKLLGPLYVEAMVGRTISRGYKQYAGDQKVDLAIPLVTFGDNRTVKSVKFNDGLLLQLKLVINILRPQN